MFDHDYGIVQGAPSLGDLFISPPLTGNQTYVSGALLLVNR